MTNSHLGDGTDAEHAEPGSQPPRIHHLPAAPLYTSTLADDAVALSEHAGLYLDPWQQQVLRESLRERSAGSWSAMECGLLVPRQNGKGAIIEARQLVAMFLTRDEQIIYSAHQFKTAKAMYRRIKDLVINTPDLDKHVRGRYRQSNEETGIEMDWGRLLFFARSKGAGRGFTGDCMFFDEAYHLDPELIADMLPTLSAVPNPQIWYVSSAGMDSSVQLDKIRQRGISGKETRLAYWEWSVERGVDLDDESAWWRANPAMGVRIDPDFVRQVERPSMSGSPEADEQFARERLGLWFEPEPEEQHQPVVPDQIWDDLRDDEVVPLLEGTVVSMDMDPKRTTLALAAAVRTRDGRVHVEVGYADKPGPGAIGYLLGLLDRWEPIALVVDRQSPAYSLVGELQRSGVEPEVTQATDLTAACGELYDRIQNGTITHTGDPLLARSLSDAQTREFTGGGWAWNRRSGGSSIAPLVAVTLACWGLTRYEIALPPPAKVPQIEAPTDTHDYIDVDTGFDALTAAF